MKIEHIIWKDYYGSESVVEGLLEIEVYWHGGGKDTFIAEGTYNSGVDDRTFKSRFKNSILGEVSEDTMGVSGIMLLRVGRIVE